MMTSKLVILSCLVFLVSFVEKSVLAQKEGDIRLRGSPDKWQGRVEIYHNKTWGTICDDYWDIKYAKVVCRQLNYPDAVAVYYTADFGKGQGQIHIDRMRCYGNETRLIDCYIKGWSSKYCTHDEDVGVACLHDSDLPLAGCSFDTDWCGYTQATDDDFDWLRVSQKTPSWDTGPAHDHTTGNGSFVYIETSYPRVQGEMARLVSPIFTGVKCIQFSFMMKGSAINELSVYIDDGLDRNMVWQHRTENRTWQNASFPVTNTGKVQIVFEGIVGVSYKGDIAIDDIVPIKKHTCDLTPANSKPEKIDLSNITHTVRLVNGNVSSAGRIEVLHKGRWGTVCGTHFHLPAAKVVCRQLGFLDVETLVPCCLFGAGKGMIWLDNLHCEGREPTLTMCPHRGWGKTSCAHDHDVGVICKTKNTLRDIRLTGADENYEGRAEVKIGGIWGTIMDYGWDIFDATVFCRQLGFGGASSAYTSAHYGQGTGPIWFSSVLCQGNETELWKCNMTQHIIQWKPHWWWQWNVHKRDAGAECYDIRLTGGKTSMEGRLEIKHLGVWGTVCNQGWDMNAAKVACRNLGFSKVVSMKVGYTIKEAEIDPIWSRFKCTGNEAVLGLCSYDPLSAGKHSCTHGNDVTIVCDAPIVRPTSETPGRKDCKVGCPGDCYRTMKHGGVCVCSSVSGTMDPACDATEGYEVSEARFPKLTFPKWDPDTFTSKLIAQLNSYCSTPKSCSKVTNGSKFEDEDILILDDWPVSFNGDLNLKFIVMSPTQYSHAVIPRDVIIQMVTKQNNKLGGYAVAMKREPIRPAKSKGSGSSNIVAIVVPIVILAIVGIGVIVYFLYKKRSAFGTGSSSSSTQRYLHLSPDDHRDQDDPLLTMEDDELPTTIRA